MMVAPNPDRSKPLVTVPRAAISPVMPFWLSLGPTASAYGLGVMSACWGAAAGIVQCRETLVSATSRLVHRSKVLHSIASPAREGLSVWRARWQHGRTPERSTTLGGSP